ncbi:STAS/SEC14 domain-containing protein [Microbacterium koreense]|uniref:STAS/SEC14 domain-containing protein n=1 Tax=Microbacterium koreense TaxID=323761 RepID=A0ABW2ZNW5_9MICO
MTIALSEKSSGNVLGFVVTGDITKEDYEVLTPAVEKAVEEHGRVRLMLDLTGFRWERVSAWGADLHFGHTLHSKIDKLAIVGDKKWEEWLAHLSTPFYAKEASFFHAEGDAFAWLAS